MTGGTGYFANKISNEYALAVGGDLYESIPKAVWAAIAVSALTSGGDQIEKAAQFVAEEWRALHDAGIVPQAPNRTACAALASVEPSP